MYIIKLVEENSYFLDNNVICLSTTNDPKKALQVLTKEVAEEIIASELEDFETEIILADTAEVL